MATLDELKSELFKSIYYNLGGDMVDVELDANHYEYALKQSFEIYRQRSSNAVEESYLFLELVKDQNEYILLVSLIYPIVNHIGAPPST